MMLNYSVVISKEKFMPKASQKTLQDDLAPVVERKRINLDLPMPAYEQLLTLGNETGKNMAEILRIGLAVYFMAHEANKKGQSIGIVQGDKVVKEIAIAS
jgi:hypothetical protein